MDFQQEKKMQEILQRKKKIGNMPTKEKKN